MATPQEQLQAMRSMAEDWDGYGGSPPREALIDFAQEFAALIETFLTKSAGDSSTIHISPTRTQGVLIEWEDSSHEHEVEINPDQSIGFLHHHKATGRIETRKFGAGQTVIPPGFLQEMRQLLAA